MDPLLERLQRLPDPRLSRWAAQFFAAHLCFNLDPVVLAAMCSVESQGGDALTPKIGGHGGDGHGWGLMQIDDRYHAFARDPKDRAEPTLNIMKGAQILRLELDRFAEDYHAAIAAYNAGPAAIEHVMLHLDSGHSITDKIAALDDVTTKDRRGRGHLTRVIEARDRLLEGAFPLPGV